MNQSPSDDFLKFTKLQLRDSNGELFKDSKTQITSFASSDKYFAVGTLSGAFYVYEYNSTKPKYFYQCESRSRSSGLSFDSTGELLLGVFVGGMIVMQDYSGPQMKQIDYPLCKPGLSIVKPICYCAIDPDAKNYNAISCVYFLNDIKSLFRLIPKSSFLRHTGHLTEEKEICRDVDLAGLSWKGDIIVWITKNGSTVVYRASKNEKLFDIRPPLEKLDSNFLQSYSILFTNNDTLMIHLNEFVCTVQISAKGKTNTEQQSKLVLKIINGSDYTAKMLEVDSKPVLQVNYNGETYSSVMPIDNFRLSDFLKNFFCLCSNKNGIFFSNPSTVLFITRLSNTEKILNYLEQNNIEKCIEQFNKLSNSVDQDDKKLLLVKIIKSLLEKGQPEKVIELCGSFETEDEWETVISFFKETKTFELIVPYIPIGTINLPPEENTEILKILLQEKEPSVFCEKFESISPEKYIPTSLIDDVAKKAFGNSQFNVPLMKLQHLNQEHTKAFTTALSISYKGFFDDIQTYRQYSYLREHFGDVLSVFKNEFSNFLIQHLEQLPPEDILKQVNLETNSANRMLNSDREKGEKLLQLIDEFKLNYLDSLRDINAPILHNEKLGTELALSYIKFKSPKTMSYLKSSGNFNLLEVSKAALDQQMYNEAAYLCKLAGDQVNGMKIHLENMNDPVAAIEYAKECDDNSIYQLLIKHSYKNEDYLRHMLDDLSNIHINPVKYIQGIPDDMILDDFEQLASKSVKEYKRKLRTAQLSQEIVSKDAFGAFKRSFNNYRMGKKTQF